MFVLSFILIFDNVLILILFILILHKSRYKRESSKLIKEIRSQVNDLVSEFDKVADRNISIMEERVKSVQKAVNNADKRLRLLDDKKSNDLISNGHYTQLKKKSLIVKKEASSKKRIQPDLFSKKNENEPVDKKEQVTILFKNGLTVRDIATKLSITMGEVELILSLSRG